MSTSDLVEIPYHLLKDPEAEIKDLIFKVAFVLLQLSMYSLTRLLELDLTSLGACRRMDQMAWVP